MPKSEGQVLIRYGPAAVLLSLSPALCAQCTPGWMQASGGFPSSEVRTLLPWDPDGAGPVPPVLLVGGNFRPSATVQSGFIAAWDGARWLPLGSGTNGTVHVIALYDPDGPGPAGPQPVIGGFFSEAGGQPASRIARWDGLRWLPLGSGVELPGSLPEVNALAALGPDLYAGGLFEYAGGVPAYTIARWDGQNWHALADERGGDASAYLIKDGELYAGGYFLSTPIPPWTVTAVLRYSNGTWLDVGDPPPGDTVRALTTYRGRLVAGGAFDEPHGAGLFISQFDGTHWGPIGEGVYGDVYALTTFDPDGPGPLPEMLIAGGDFTYAGTGPASQIAAWDGTRWSALGAGVNGRVYALAVYNNQLIAGGQFITAGGLFSPFLAVWGCPQAAPCYANCDQSTEPPVLNVNDFLCFLSAFSAGSPYANCDGSTAAPPLNVNDFICFLGRFVQGCP